jgi:dipeptidyl aminopeptidase/acylaminoacyl peptidase
VKWWDLSTGHVIKTLVGHSDYVTSVTFSPNGKTALSGAGTQFENQDNTVKWWDLSTGQVIKTLVGHSSGVYSVAFSPNSQTALSGSHDNTVKWWDLSTGHVIKALEGYSVAFSPDGKTALSGDNSFSLLLNKGDNTVKWWDLSTGDVIKTLKGHSGSVKSVAFSPDGKTALLGGWDNTVKWWDLSTGHVINTLVGHSDYITSVTFSPDGKTALSGSRDTTTRLWNLETGKEIIQMVGFDDGEGIAIMPKQGYYTASPKGEQYINVRVGNRSYGIEKYKTFYHRPDIIQLALQLGDAQRAIALVNQQKTQVAQATQETPPSASQRKQPTQLAQVTQETVVQPTPVTLPSTQPQKRTALIIGNAVYQGYSPLKNPVNDATDLATVLKKLNFEVIEKHNLNYAQMEEAILAYDEKLRQNPGVGLFYFSGHGVQYQGTNYLIPVDGTRLLRNPKQLRYKAVAASYIQTTMEAAGNRVNLLILDACRNSPTFIKSLFKGEMAPPGLGYMVATSGSLIAYAASPGGVAVDGNGRNSPYVSSLMHWIQKHNLSINQVLRGVRNEVVKKTDGKQSPGYYDELNEDFYFSR